MQRRSLPAFTGRDHQRILSDTEHEDILRDHENIFPPDQNLSEVYENLDVNEISGDDPVQEFSR